MNRFIKYATDISGEVKHISEVNEGLDCRCFCSACGGSFVAIKEMTGQQSQFVHYEARNCKQGYECSLLLFAFKILSSIRQIRVPSGNLAYKINHSELFPVRKLKIVSTFLDQQNVKVGPHISLVLENGARLNLFVIVTHPIDKNKEAIIRAENTSALEIDLSFYKHQLEEDDFESEIVDDVFNKRWLYYKEEETLMRNIAQLAEKKDTYITSGVKYIVGCPQKKMKNAHLSKNLIKEETCNNCPFNISSAKDLSHNGSQLCLGYLQDIEKINYENVETFVRTQLESNGKKPEKNDQRLLTISDLWQNNPEKRPLLVINNFSNKIFEISANPISAFFRYGEVYGKNLDDFSNLSHIYYHNLEIWSLVEDEGLIRKFQ